MALVASLALTRPLQSVNSNCLPSACLQVPALITATSDRAREQPTVTYCTSKLQSRPREHEDQGHHRPCPMSLPPRPRGGEARSPRPRFLRCPNPADPPAPLCGPRPHQQHHLLHFTSSQKTPATLSRLRAEHDETLGLDITSTPTTLTPAPPPRRLAPLHHRRPRRSDTPFHPRQRQPPRQTVLIPHRGRGPHLPGQQCHDLDSSRRNTLLAEILDPAGRVPARALYPTVKGAWWRFEHGTRSCLAQDQVMAQSSVILAVWCSQWISGARLRRFWSLGTS
jgi:hypothetical protein